MFRWSLCALLLVAPSAGAQPDERPLSWERYIALVKDYRDGAVDWGSARGLLTQKGPVESAVRNLRSFPLQSGDLKAAVLLHTEVATLYVEPGAGRTRDLQMEIAEKIISLVKEEPFRRTWHLAAGYFYQSVMSPGQASYHFEKLLELTPHDVDLLLAMGTVQETLGAFELSKIPKWSHSNPTFTQTQREKRRIAAIEKRGRQRLRGAIDWYTKAARQDPSAAMPRVRRGHCYSLLDEPSEAVEELTRAAILADGSYESGLASLFLAQLHREQQDLDEAVAQYRRAVAKLPKWQVGYFGLSEALSASGRREESRVALERGLTIPVRANDPTGGLWQYYLRMDLFSQLVERLRSQVLR